MNPRPPRSIRPDTLLPYTTLFRSPRRHQLCGPRDHGFAVYGREGFRCRAFLLWGRLSYGPNSRWALIRPVRRSPNVGDRIAIMGPLYGVNRSGFYCYRLRRRALPVRIFRGRSDERRVGKEWVRTGRLRGW